MEKLNIQECLQDLQKVLEIQRLNERCARSVGLWQTDGKLVKLIKTNSFCHKLGFLIKNGYMRPEEVLYLLETNRFELLWKNTTCSLQQAYSILIPLINIDKYLLMRKLLINGFIPSKLSLDRKRNILNEDTYVASKKNCQQVSSSFISSNANNSVENQSKIEKVMAEIKSLGPKQFEGKISAREVKVDFYLNRNESRESIDILWCGDEMMDPKLALCENSSSVILGFYQFDSISYYKFLSINGPL